MISPETKCHSRVEDSTDIDFTIDDGVPGARTLMELKFSLDSPFAMLLQ